jgi:hypothetical protein
MQWQKTCQGRTRSSCSKAPASVIAQLHALPLHHMVHIIVCAYIFFRIAQHSLVSSERGREVHSVAPELPSHLREPRRELFLQRRAVLQKSLYGHVSIAEDAEEERSPIRHRQGCGNSRRKWTEDAETSASLQKKA